MYEKQSIQSLKVKHCCAATVSEANLKRCQRSSRKLRSGPILRCTVHVFLVQSFKLLLELKNS